MERGLPTKASSRCHTCVALACAAMALLLIALFIIWIAISLADIILALPSPHEVWAPHSSWDEFPWGRCMLILLAMFVVVTTGALFYDLSKRYWILPIVMKGVIFTIIGASLLLVCAWTHLNVSLTVDNLVRVIRRHRKIAICMSAFVALEIWHLIRNFVVALTHNRKTVHSVWPSLLVSLIYCLHYLLYLLFFHLGPHYNKTSMCKAQHYVTFNSIMSFL